MSTEKEPTTIIDVYCDDEEFKTHKKYWMMPVYKLQSLFICRYVCKVDKDDSRFQSCIDQLYKDHPGSILIY